MKRVIWSRQYLMGVKPPRGLCSGSNSYELVPVSDVVSRVLAKLASVSHPRPTVKNSVGSIGIGAEYDDGGGGLRSTLR